jgi:hypothetical protein
MAFGMYLTPSLFTPERYDEVNSRSKRLVPERRQEGFIISLSKSAA